MAYRFGYPLLDAYAANLVAAWRFNGADAATSGGGFADAIESHDLTAAADAQIDTAQSMDGGSSLLIDSSGDYCSAADSADWRWKSVSLWVRCASVAGNIGVFQQYADANNRAGLIFDQANGWLALNVTSGGTTIIDVQANWSPAINTWYHIAVVNDSSANDWKIYIDNSDATTSGGSDADTIPDISAPLYIGRYTGGSGTSWYLNGHLDEMYIWDSAISAAAVTALYNSGNGRFLAQNLLPIGMQTVGSGIALLPWSSNLILPDNFIIS